MFITPNERLTRKKRRKNKCRTFTNLSNKHINKVHNLNILDVQT